MTRTVSAAFVLVLAALSPGAAACTAKADVCFEETLRGFPLVQDGNPATVVSDPMADPAIRRVAASFADDLARVSGREAASVGSVEEADGPMVLIGELGRDKLIDALVAKGKLDPGSLDDRWEAFLVETVAAPWPGTEQVLVIAGSDRRGVVYGTYDLSERIGISPWNWFADVPIERQLEVSITPGQRIGRPRVRYRGFFINDEDPAFSGWAKNRFGGVNADMYEHVFELLLRLKGNYIWPAMWAPKAFHLDDPRNAVLADSMGVVMGTSHHEPLTRAQSEWHRLPDSTGAGGEWNYTRNAANLRKFWRGGIERMMSKEGNGGYENLVTVGMRGDGDEPMAESTAIDLLENIVEVQREIIADVTKQPAENTPQVWALYKEVQDYYDQGMIVPDDITLLFADDNWGQIRRLPTSNARRKGGYGVYYHFDYVGAPRNYKWLNSNQVGKVWQQMNLAWERGARNVWVVNVGDLKPMEYPLDFFMRMAWDPEAMTLQALSDFPEQWSRRTFPGVSPNEVGGLVTRYSRLAALRKPESLNENTFPLGEGTPPLLDVGQFGNIVADWRKLVADMEAVRTRVPDGQRSAFFQLIEFPILALSNLYELYYATAWNQRLASRHDARANYFLNKAVAAFERDSELTEKYHSINDGKWDKMMSQVHMNYVHWNEPVRQTLPSLTRVAADTPSDMRDVKVEFLEDPEVDDSYALRAASDFDRSYDGMGLSWTPVPDIGQYDFAITSLPQGRPPTTHADGIRVEYDFETARSGDLQVSLYLVPTLDTTGSGRIRIGVSVDDGPVRELKSSLEPTAGSTETPEKRAWAEAVLANIHILETEFSDLHAGRHMLKVWRLDDNAVIQHIEIRELADL